LRISAPSKCASLFFETPSISTRNGLPTSALLLSARERSLARFTSPVAAAFFSLPAHHPYNVRCAEGARAVRCKKTI
jgi:hypothetical protein